jgi:hypothetical protein
MFAKSIATLSLIAASSLVASSVQAQSLQPGLWYFWKSPKEVKPNTVPVSGMCLDDKDVRTPAVLVAQFPGDESCRLSSIRARADGATEFDIMCGGAERTSVAVSRTSERQFVTRITPIGGSPGSATTFVYGSNAGPCTK